jgi:hypothetical protein
MAGNRARATRAIEPLIIDPVITEVAAIRTKA